MVVVMHSEVSFHPHRMERSSNEKVRNASPNGVQRVLTKDITLLNVLPTIGNSCRPGIENRPNIITVAENMLMGFRMSNT